MTPEHPDRPAGSRIPAQQRLAQTRSEIAALILPLPPDAPPADLRQAAWRQERRSAQTDAELAAMLRRQQQDDAELAAVQQRAYLAHLQRQQAEEEAAAAGMRVPPVHVAVPRGAPPPGFAWKPLLRRGVAIWWRHHPAHAVVEVADSMLSHVARRKPWQMLAVAAGAGAVVVLIRPWRLISLTGLALAAVKASDMRGALGSMLRGD